MTNNVAITAGTGTDIASDDVAGVHYQVGKLAIGTEDSAVRIGHAEDAAHTSGDGGIMALAVRKDTPSAVATTDGDYIPLIVDSTGRQWVNVGAITAGETHVGEVGGNTVIIRSNPTITAGAYSANDVVGGKLTLTSAMRVSGGTGVLHSLTIHDKNAANAALEFYVFQSTPLASIADNGAFAWTDTDEDLFLGMVAVAAGDYTGRGGDAFVTLRNLGLPVAASGSANLFCYIVCTTAPTYASTTDLTFTFGFLRD